MSTKLPSTNDLFTARVGHLNLIQSVVSRLATFSANAKNFCVTVLAALLGVAFQQHLPLLLLAAAFVVVSFAALDVYYLAQERRFRDFYRDVVNRPLSDAAQMDMSPSKLSLQEYVAGILSFSTGGFYSLLLIVGVALLPLVHERADEDVIGYSDKALGSAKAQRAAVGAPASVVELGADVPSSTDSGSSTHQPATGIGSGSPIQDTAVLGSNQGNVLQRP